MENKPIVWQVSADNFGKGILLRAISDMRREELAQAALEVFLTHGAEGMTLERVAKVAGSSKGTVLHYYQSKEALLDRVLRDVLRVLGQEARAAVAAHPGVGQKIGAQLALCFRAELFTPDYARAWLSVVAKSPENKGLDRFRRLIARRLRSNLRAQLRPLVGATEARPIAESLAALIDGLWLRRAVDPGSLTPERAAALAQTHLEESLAFL